MPFFFATSTQAEFNTVIDWIDTLETQRLGIAEENFEQVLNSPLRLKAVAKFVCDSTGKHFLAVQLRNGKVDQITGQFLIRVRRISTNY